MYDLINNVHVSIDFQNDFNKYGIESLKFNVIHRQVKYNKDKLLRKEQELINKYDSINAGYNTIVAHSKVKTDQYKNIFSFNESILNDVELKKRLMDNLIIFDKPKLLYIENNSFGYGWLNRQNKNDIKNISNNMLNFQRNHINAKQNEIYYTCHDSFKNTLPPKGCKKSFANLKESLEDKRNNLMFMHNPNLHPNLISSMINNEDVFDKKVFTKEYRLCCLINWINNVADTAKPINLYIPNLNILNELLLYLDRDEIRL